MRSRGWLNRYIQGKYFKSYLIRNQKKLYRLFWPHPLICNFISLKYRSYPLKTGLQEAKITKSSNLMSKVSPVQELAFKKIEHFSFLNEKDLHKF